MKIIPYINEAAVRGWNQYRLTMIQQRFDTIPRDYTRKFFSHAGRLLERSENALLRYAALLNAIETSYGGKITFTDNLLPIRRRTHGITLSDWNQCQADVKILSSTSSKMKRANDRYIRRHAELRILARLDDIRPHRIVELYVRDKDGNIINITDLVKKSDRDFS